MAKRLMINLEKIRGLPEGKRKIILWFILIVIGLGLISIYFINIRQNIRNFKSLNLKEGFKIPDFGEEFKSLPKLEMPTATEEELNKLQEEIQKNEEGNQTNTSKETSTTE